MNTKNAIYAQHTQIMHTKADNHTLIHTKSAVN